MALSDYVDAHDQQPNMACKIAGSFVQNPIAIEFSKSFDQSTQTCTVTFGAPLAQTPDNSTQVIVYEGYNNFTVPTFTGYVDDYKAGAFPNTWILSLRDVLKRAEDYWLDDVGVSYNQMQAETAIANLLSLCGLSVTAGTTNFTIGDVSPATFKLVSILDACTQIASLIGWKLWAGRDGTVYFQYRKPRPSQSPVWTYQLGKNILSVQYYDVTDKDLRNRVVVLGYTDPTSGNPIKSVAYAASSFTTFYRTAILSSELIDTQNMAQTIAGWMLTDLNTLCYIYEFECVGNPLLDIGNTINVTDSARNVNGNFFVFSIRSTNKSDTGDYTYHIQAVRWDNNTVPNYENPPPTPVTPPAPTPPPLPGPVGLGNLLYVSSLEGLAMCKGAYGTTGLDGTPVWTNLSATPVAGAGTITQSGNTVTGSGTAFTTAVAVNDRISASGISGNVTAIASDTSLTLDTSATQGTGQSYTIFKLAAGLTPAARKIRHFNFDPYSVTTDHFTAAWAMTDDGLYHITGLPDAPVWTQQLSQAQADTAAGNPSTYFNTRPYSLTYNFTPSTRKPGFIATQICYYTDYGKTWKGVSLPNDGIITFVLYSYDYGVTWNCDNTKFLVYGGILTGLAYFDTAKIVNSYHLDDTYYIGNSPYGTSQSTNPPIGDETNPVYGSPQISLWRAPGSRATQFPDFSPGMADGLAPAGDSFGNMAQPFSDANGNVYADDNRCYLFGSYNKFGTQAVLRYTAAFNPLWSLGYTPPTYTAVGDAAMYQMFNLTINPLNENYGYAVDAHGVAWLTNTLAGTPTWSQYGNSVIPSRSVYAINLSNVVATNVMFLVGKSSSGALGAVWHTPDFGTTWVDDDLNTATGNLTTVLGLLAGDMDYSVIRVDYYKS